MLVKLCYPTGNARVSDNNDKYQQQYIVPSDPHTSYCHLPGVRKGDVCCIQDH